MEGTAIAHLKKQPDPRYQSHLHEIPAPAPVPAPVPVPVPAPSRHSCKGPAVFSFNLESKRCFMFPPWAVKGNPPAVDWLFIVKGRAATAKRLALDYEQQIHYPPTPLDSTWREPQFHIRKNSRTPAPKATSTRSLPPSPSPPPSPSLPLFLGKIFRFAVQLRPAFFD